MRLLVVGCEYVGVSTLINELDVWGNERGIHHHLDDHFTIPDVFHLSLEEQTAMRTMLPAIKERFQRFQIAYHVRLLHRYDHILMGGMHIEEMIYGPRYYYPGIDIDVREYEPDLPDDTILVHLFARAEVVRERMRANPHPHQLVPSEDVPEILGQYAEEVQRSLILRKMALDTSDLTPRKLLAAFLERSIPHLSVRDMLIRQWH